MKRLLLLLGPVVALTGSLGLVMYGRALIGVFEVLTVDNFSARDRLPAALAELQWAMMSAMTLVIGLVISCVATVMRNSGRTISTIGRLLYTVAGVSLIIGAMPLAWAIMGAKASFRILATAQSSPKIENLQEMILSAESTMTIGYAVFVLSAVLLIVAGSTGFQATPSQANDRQSPLSVNFAIGPVLVGGVLLLLIISVRFNGNALGMMITETSVTPQPAELAAHLTGILNKSLFVFGGLATLGLLQLLASIFAPSAGSDSGSEV